MTMTEQYGIYIKQLQTRKRKRVKKSTLDAYQSYFLNWIQPNIGSLEVSAVENGVMKTLVAKMGEAGRKPSTITSIQGLVKDIIKSATDENGNQLYPKTWNTAFVDAPIIDRKAQKAPVMTPTEVTERLSIAPGQYGPFIALLAASGLRISEALALRVGPQPESSYWDARQSKLVIRTQLYKGEEQSPKTIAGAREVDLAPELNDYLMEFFGLCVNCDGLRKAGDYLFQGPNGGPLSVWTGYGTIKRLGVPGFHSLRRFYRTHLENVGCPRGLSMYWMGHAAKDVDDLYVRLDKNIQARKEWARRIGLGFTLPTANSAVPVEEEITLIGHKLKIH